jgi:hypothetical protein
MQRRSLSVLVGTKLGDDLQALARVDGVSLTEEIRQLLEAWVQLRCEDAKVAEQVRKLAQKIQAERAQRPSRTGPRASNRVVKTVYLRRDLIQRLEAEYQRRPVEAAHTPKGSFLEAIIEAGLPEVEHSDRSFHTLSQRPAGVATSNRVIRSYYLRCDLIERLEAEHRRRQHSELGVPTFKADLLEAVLEAGLERGSFAAYPWVAV